MGDQHSLKPSLPDRSPPKAKPSLPDRNPPKAKPRSKPLPRGLSEPLSDSHPEEKEPRYTSRPKNFSKEAEYPLSNPGPVSKELTMAGSPARPAGNGLKPPITPRKNTGQPKPSARLQKQPDYLDLVDESHDYEEGARGAGSVPPAFSEEIVQNFTPQQLDKLISMLQQVQTGGQPKATATMDAQCASSSTASHTQMKRNFGEFRHPQHACINMLLFVCRTSC